MTAARVSYRPGPEQMFDPPAREKGELLPLFFGFVFGFGFRPCLSLCLISRNFAFLFGLCLCQLFGFLGLCLGKLLCHTVTVICLTIIS